ncbi:MAG: hypothetical protein J7M14_06620 [Planctomycetes bacterium]|nr:hypothetical protein [Planctomycetota bacterium]
MTDKEFTIELKCLFCDSILQGEPDKEYSSGNLLQCQECKELNDYDSLIDVATEEGKEKAEEYAHREIEKMLNNVFK